MYYLSTEGKVPASFENLYYDEDYDAQALSQKKYRHISKKENSLKNTDLENQNCKKKPFYSDPRENVHGKCTEIFCSLTDHVCEKPSNENFDLFDSNTEVGTYDATFTVEEKSYSTVRTPLGANSHIYFCQYCTVNLQKIHIDKKLNVLFLCMPSLCITPP